MQGQVIRERYRIEHCIGRGGMAMVYKAFDAVLRRPVAVKILHAQFTHNSHFVERFKREAHAAASLIHPNITTIYDTGFANGVYFIIMEYVDGTTLKQLIDARAPLPPNEVAYIIKKIAEALGHAHTRRIIHRDVKPQNILITDDEQVKVADFGIARALLMPGLTQTGKVLGTARYLSPEVARGRQADHRSDLYSLGVIMFEMLTGSPPFEGSSSLEVARKHIAQAPPKVRDVNPRAPMEFEMMVHRLLRKDPEERYQDVAKLVEDIVFWEAEDKLAHSMPPVPPRERRSDRKKADRTHKKARKRRRLTHFAKTLIAASFLAALGFGAYLVADSPDDTVYVPPKKQAITERFAKEQVGVLTPIEAVDYDPSGNGDENPSQVEHVVDGDESSAWACENYRSATFGDLKEGVGVYIDYGQNAEVEELTLISSGGWSGAIKSSDDMLKWETVREITNAGKQLSVRIEASKHQFYLVWFSKLTPVGPHKYRCKIYEVRARGKSLRF